MRHGMANDFVATTGLHGIQDLGHARGLVRLGWSVVLFCLASRCMYQCVQMVQLYMAEPTTMTVRPMRNYGLDKILYCPHAWVNQEEGERKGYDADLQAYVYSFGWSSPEVSVNYDLRYAYAFASKQQNLRSAFLAKNVSLSQAMVDISYRPEDVIVGVKASALTLGGVQYVVEREVHVLGICYTISIKNSFSQLAGPLREIVLYVSHRENLITQISPDSRGPSDLWQFEAIHGTMPTCGASNLRSGRNVSISLSQRSLSIISTNRSPCLDYSTQEFIKCTLQKFDVMCAATGKTLYMGEIRSELEDGMRGYIDSAAGAGINCAGADPQIVRRVDACKLTCGMLFRSAKRVHYLGKSEGDIFTVRISMSNPVWFEGQHQMIAFTGTSLLSAVGGAISLYFGASLVALAHAAIALVGYRLPRD